MIEYGRYVPMETEAMTHYEPNTPQLMRKMELEAEAAVAQLTKVTESTREQFYYALTRDIIDQEYDIGKLVGIYQIYGGYVNTTFGIYTEKDGQKYTWILRKYRAGKTVDALLFEHKLLKHAREHGFSFCSVPIPAIDGKTYVAESVEYAQGSEQFLFAIFNYIEGQSPYDWINNWAEAGFQENTLISGARNLAEFHSATASFDGEGLIGDNLFGTNEDLNVNELIADFPRRMVEWQANMRATGFDNKYSEYFESYYDFYVDVSRQATIPSEPYRDMVMTACHLDFHGGNFKYATDGMITGSFDYDMAMVDSRLFDIALSMHYVFASWRLLRDGELNMARIERFIKAYNENCAAIDVISPLNETEKRWFYEAMLQAPVYVYGWCNGAIYADKSVDPFEYMYYAEHCHHAIQWLQAHEQEVRELGMRL